MKVTILGLSVTSAWGNGHATNFRALARALQQSGDQVTFLERDVPWYAAHRDLPEPPWCETHLYGSVAELKESSAGAVRQADLVIVGSFVPDGVEVTRWVLQHARGAVAFYDIDTPITIGKLRAGDTEYLSPELVERFGTRPGASHSTPTTRPVGAGRIMLLVAAMPSLSDLRLSPLRGSTQGSVPSTTDVVPQRSREAGHGTGVSICDVARDSSDRRGMAWGECDRWRRAGVARLQREREGRWRLPNR